jgi:predicted membrane protein
MYKLAEFMQGRYGNDKLNTFLLIVTAVIYVIKLFVRSAWLFVVLAVPVALYIFRALSKNINKRLYENRKFESIYSVVETFFKRQYLKVRDFKTHRYVKCPYCKSQLRLKKRTGVQKIHCPRCNEDFKKNILF